MGRRGAECARVTLPPAARALSTLSRVDHEDGFLVETGPAQDRTGEPADLRQAVLVRLMEQRQISDPFGFLVYAELAGAEVFPVG